MIGYHCFEQYNAELSEFAEVELLVQLLSILYWKRAGNEIKLFTEDKHLRTLEKFRMHYLYSDIDTEAIKDFPDNIDKKRFWAIAKVRFHSIIPEDEYCILDTDMFLRRIPELDKSMSFIAAHPESHLSPSGLEFYPGLESILSGEKLEDLKQYSEVAPTNTSFMYLNDKELVDLWSKEAIAVAEELSKQPAKTPNEMMSIEQWLLPILATKHNKSYTTLISNSYIPGNTLRHNIDWEPMPQEGGNLGEMQKIFFHLWGAKKILSNKKILDMILTTLAYDIKKTFPGYRQVIRNNFRIIKKYL